MEPQPELRLDEFEFHHGEAAVVETDQIDTAVGRHLVAGRQRPLGKLHLLDRRLQMVNGAAVVVLHPEVARLSLFPQAMRHAAGNRDERVFAGGHDIGDERLQQKRLAGEQRVDHLLHRGGR